MGYQSDNLRFLFICIFFVLWLIISIIPGLGIIGDLLFRAVIPGVPTIDPFTPVINYIKSWFSIKAWLKIWKIWDWSIWSIFSFKWWEKIFSYLMGFMLDMIPIIGPIINFLIFLKKGYF